MLFITLIYIMTMDTSLVRTVEPPQNVSEAAEVEERGSQAALEMTEYLRGLIATRRDRPGDDLISALVVSTSQDDGGQMNEQELLASLQLLLIAGYETYLHIRKALTIKVSLY